MQKLVLLLFFVLSIHILHAQRGMLFIKKGYKKVATYVEGSDIRLEIDHSFIADGYIALIKNDSVYVSGMSYHQSQITAVFLPQRKEEHLAQQLLYTTAGVALSTAGITLAKWESFKKALALSAGLGFARYLFKIPGLFKRKKYSIGKKFSIQLLDLHFTGRSR